MIFALRQCGYGMKEISISALFLLFSRKGLRGALAGGAPPVHRNNIREDGANMSIMIRRLDELGRVTLPWEVRQEAGWSEKTPLEITVEADKSVLVRACKPICKLCGGGDSGLIAVAAGSICKPCLQAALINSVNGMLEDDATDEAGDGAEMEKN